MKYNYHNKLLILKAIQDKSNNEIAKIIKRQGVKKPWDWAKTKEWQLVKDQEKHIGLTETHIKNLFRG